MILHTGPISEFVLHIPNVNMFPDSFEEVDQWMIILSRSGVRELILTNSNKCYNLPCSMFSCLQLRKLELENCFFKPPLEFEGFLSLEDLYLTDMNFGDNLSRTQISLPQLKKLYLVRCTNAYNFNINIKATQLKSLTVISCHDAMFLQLLHSPCLTKVVMWFQKHIEDNLRVGRMTLAMILSKLTNTEHLYVNGLFFKFLIAENVPKWFPHPTNSLQCLRLRYLELGDVDQLHGALCLLWNSPNLKQLHLEMEPQFDVGPASNHLEAPDCLDCTLNHLQTVEIENLQGSRAELIFIKLLLAHSPSLENITITPSRVCGVQKRLDTKCKNLLLGSQAISISSVTLANNYAEEQRES